MDSAAGRLARRSAVPSVIRPRRGGLRLRGWPREQAVPNWPVLRTGRPAEQARLPNRPPPEWPLRWSGAVLPSACPWRRRLGLGQPPRSQSISASRSAIVLAISMKAPARSPRRDSQAAQPAAGNRRHRTRTESRRAAGNSAVPWTARRPGPWPPRSMPPRMTAAARTIATGTPQSCHGLDAWLGISRPPTASGHLGEARPAGVRGCAPR